MAWNRTNHICSIALCLQIIAGCSGEHSQHSRESDKDLFFNVSVDLQYGKYNINLTRIIRCSILNVDGGSLGQSPDITTRKAYPQTVGKALPDGSFIALRVPELCLINRKNFKEGEIQNVGWERAGQFSIFPLLIWADRRTKATEIEEYISPIYYISNKSKLKIIKSTVEFYQNFDAQNIKPNVDQVDNPLADNVIKMDQMDVRNSQLGHNFAAVASIPFAPSSHFVKVDGNGKSPLSPYKDPSRRAMNCIERLQNGRPDISNLPPDPRKGFNPVLFDTSHSKNNFGEKSNAEKKTYFDEPSSEKYCYKVLSEIKSFRKDSSEKFYLQSQQGLLSFFPMKSMSNKDLFSIGKKMYKIGDKTVDITKSNSIQIDKIWNLVLDPNAGQ